MDSPTFGYIMEDGKRVRVVILRTDGKLVVVRPLGAFNRIIALSADAVSTPLE